MHPLCLSCLLLMLTTVTWAQPSKKKQPVVTCDMVCDELFAAIRANPEKLSMRLEEALVIKESCAGELVTAAIAAVDNEPTLVRRIQQTALEMSPRYKADILAAVRDYKVVTVAVAEPQLVEEVRRAELPDIKKAKALPGEEIRRAQLPDSAQVAQVVPEMNLMSVPKARPLR